MRILLTNDDGIAAPGLLALHRAIRSLGQVHVVAPATVQSAMSHSITFDRPIATRLHRVQVEGDREEGDGFEGVAVEGSPADCVKLALTTLLPEPVDVVISGMNAGANIGVNVTYSGTVAAAMEAGYLGTPGIAVSLHIGRRERTRWTAAAEHARRVIEQLLAGPLDPHTVLNLNVPILDDGAPPRGLRVVPVSTSGSADQYQATEHDSGDMHYEACGGIAFQHTPPDSDVQALLERYITLSPLTLDRTRHDQLAPWRRHLEAAASPSRCT